MLRRGFFFLMPSHRKFNIDKPTDDSKLHAISALNTVDFLAIKFRV